MRWRVSAPGVGAGIQGRAWAVPCANGTGKSPGDTRLGPGSCRHWLFRGPKVNYPREPTLLESRLRGRRIKATALRGPAEQQNGAKALKAGGQQGGPLRPQPVRAAATH